jgi:cephalosporin hydroxylase
MDGTVSITIAVPDREPISVDIQPEHVVEWFHRLYWMGPGAKPISWLTWPMMKNPMDLWVYQKLIVDCSPDLIVETGTFWGGSAVFMATVCDLLDHGEIVTVDIKPPPDRPQHARITYINADSAAPEIVAQVVERAADKSVMVILDSDHSQEHVLKELAAYAPLVTPGQYLIVEDTNINGHPVMPEFGPGPWEALEEWLPAHPEFARDPGCEAFLMTWNPGGYLRRL